MPRSCSICSHPEYQAIAQALAAKAPYRDIAERFGTSPAALHRHQAHTQRPANTVPMDEPLTHALPIPEAPALLDTAQRLHTTAHHLHRRTVEVRSLYDPKLLQHMEELARLHVEVTGLLAEVIGLLAALTAGSGNMAKTSVTPVRK